MLNAAFGPLCLDAVLAQSGSNASWQVWVIVMKARTKKNYSHLLRYFFSLVSIDLYIFSAFVSSNNKSRLLCGILRLWYKLCLWAIFFSVITMWRVSWMIFIHPDFHPDSKWCFSWTVKPAFKQHYGWCLHHFCNSDWWLVWRGVHINSTSISLEWFSYANLEYVQYWYLPPYHSIQPSSAAMAAAKCQHRFQVSSVASDIAAAVQAESWWIKHTAMMERMHLIYSVMEWKKYADSGCVPKVACWLCFIALVQLWQKKEIREVMGCRQQSFEPFGTGTVLYKIVSGAFRVTLKTAVSSLGVYISLHGALTAA